MLCYRPDLPVTDHAVRIRMAGESDLDTAAQLWFERIALLRETDANIVLAPAAIQSWQRQAKYWIEEDEYAFFVAESDGELAGILVVGISENLPWLQPKRLGSVVQMVLDLHRTRHGLSGALLERAKAWLQAREVAVLEVEPSARYPVEEAFWRAQGGNVRSLKFWLKI